MLYMHERLSKGESIVKCSIMTALDITAKTFQRDIDSLRAYYAENDGGELIYDRKCGCYYLETSSNKLTKKEIFALSKILIESRAFNKGEFDTIITKLLMQCGISEAQNVKALIANERVNYIPLQHGKSLINTLWELADCAAAQRLVTIGYTRLDGTVRMHEIKPVGLMFSEFYFYLISYISDDSKPFPTVFRADRINSIQRHDERFYVPYRDKFSEAEFRKRVQFMYSGEMRIVRFLYKGNLEAVLDRLPTARVEKHTEGGAVIRAEAFGDGIDVWLRSQGDLVEMMGKV